MILSEAELEIGEDADGIMVLMPADSSLQLRGRRGCARDPARRGPAVADAVLDLDLNPNRVDCLGVYGVAREVHAITGAELAPAPWDDRRRAGRRGGARPITPR